MKHKSKKYSCDHCHTKLRFTANTAGFVAAIDALDYVICPVCTLALRNEEPEEDERFESASNDFPVGKGWVCHEDLSEYQKWMKAEQERNDRESVKGWVCDVSKPNLSRYIFLQMKMPTFSSCDWAIIYDSVSLDYQFFEKILNCAPGNYRIISVKAISLEGAIDLVNKHIYDKDMFLHAEFEIFPLLTALFPELKRYDKPPEPEPKPEPEPEKEPEPVEEAPKPAPALVDLIGGHKRHDFVDADPNEDISSMIW